MLYFSGVTPRRPLRQDMTLLQTAEEHGKPFTTLYYYSGGLASLSSGEF